MRVRFSNTQKVDYTLVFQLLHCACLFQEILLVVDGCFMEEFDGHVDLILLFTTVSFVCSLNNGAKFSLTDFSTYSTIMMFIS